MHHALEADLASKNAWLGNFLLVGAVLCEAAYAVIGKKLTGVLSPKRITALINKAAEAMAIAAMEHRRRLEEQKRRAKMKL